MASTLFLQVGPGSGRCATAGGGDTVTHMASGAARRRSETMLVTTYDGEVRRRHPDELIVEEPMTVQLDGIVVSTTMRTPGNDYELAAGFCLTEGLLGSAPIIGVRYCAAGPALETAFNVVTVDTGGRAPAPAPRLGTTTSSCGLCGSESIETLCDRLAPLPPTASIPLGVLATVPAAVLAGQGLFEATGAVHAAAAFDPAGEVIVVREDVGRHNAVDKVIGRLLLDARLPATGLGLFVSGRASFELVQKAWAAGFSTLVAVSAPTSLAVHTARRAGLVLAGFVRGTRVNIYAPEQPRP
jgi:FdhD protein